MTLITKLINTLKVGSKSQSSSTLAELCAEPNQSKAQLLSFQNEPSKWTSANDVVDGNSNCKTTYQKKSKLRLYLTSSKNNSQPNHYSATDPKSLNKQRQNVKECLQNDIIMDNDATFEQMFERVVPKPIRLLLNDLYVRGPQTEGIFRKSPNAKHCRELRQLLDAALKNEQNTTITNNTSKKRTYSQHITASNKLLHQTTTNHNINSTQTTANRYGSRQNSAPILPIKRNNEQTSSNEDSSSIAHLQETIEQYHVNVVASVFKEWLRSQTDCVLMSYLYPQWIDAAKLIEPISSLPTTVPEPEALALQLSKQFASKQSSSASNDPHHLHSSSKPSQSQSQQTHTQTTEDDEEEEGDSSIGRQTRNWPRNYTGGDASRASNSSSGNSSHNEDNISSDDSLAAATKTETTNRRTTASCLTSSNDGTSSSSQSNNNNNNHGNGDDAAAAAANNSTAPRSDLPSKVSTMIEDTSYLVESEEDKQRLWLSLAERRAECLRVVRQLLTTINEPNLVLLKAIVCVLWRISRDSECNKMSTQNLGVCVGQSLLHVPMNANSATTCTTLAPGSKRMTALRTTSSSSALMNASSMKRQQQQHLASNQQQQQTHQFSQSAKDYRRSSSNLHHSLLGLSLSNGGSLAATVPQQPQPTSLGHKISSAAASTFATKRHRRARSQSLLASTLSLSSLSSLQLHSNGAGPNNSNCPSRLGHLDPSAAGGALAHAISQHQLSSVQTGTYLQSSDAQETAKYVPMLVAFMIEHASALFGQETLALFARDSRPIDNSAVIAPVVAVDVTDGSAPHNERPVDVPQEEAKECTIEMGPITEPLPRTMQQTPERLKLPQQQDDEEDEEHLRAMHSAPMRQGGSHEALAVDESSGGSSSRASSSTSGLHSESPALSSSEQDSPQHQSEEPNVTPAQMMVSPTGGATRARSNVAVGVQATSANQQRQQAVYTLSCYRNSLPPVMPFQQQQQTYSQQHPHQAATIGSQRSHVMLLRDYYLSLQHQQQQQSNLHLRRRSAVGDLYGPGKGARCTAHNDSTNINNNNNNNNSRSAEKECSYGCKQRSVPVEKMARQSSQPVYGLSAMQHQHQQSLQPAMKPIITHGSSQHLQPSNGFQQVVRLSQHLPYQPYLHPHHSHPQHHASHHQRLNDNKSSHVVRKHPADDSSATTVVVVEAAHRAGDPKAAAATMQQPATASAATLHRPQPRMALIRPNQFNGLYVRNVSASATQPPMVHNMSNGSSLHPHSHLGPHPNHHIAAASRHLQQQRQQQQFATHLLIQPSQATVARNCSAAAASVVVTNHAMTHRNQYSKDSNHSSAEQSLSSSASSSDESDESFIGECMESTMV